MVEKKEEIEFPCTWNYRIIIEEAKVSCLDLVIELLESYGITTKPEKKSKSANEKYQAYRVSVVFDSREMMDSLSSKLSAIDGVKFVL